MTSAECPWFGGVNRYMSRKISRVCGQVHDTYGTDRSCKSFNLLGGTERLDYETEMLILASRAGCRIVSIDRHGLPDEVNSIHRFTTRFGSSN